MVGINIGVMHDDIGGKPTFNNSCKKPHGVNESKMKKNVQWTYISISLLIHFSIQAISGETPISALNFERVWRKLDNIFPVENAIKMKW